VIGLGKLKLHTTFEVVSFFYYGNMGDFSLKIGISQYGNLILCRWIRNHSDSRWSRCTDNGQPTDDFLSHPGCRLPLPSVSVGLAIIRSWVRYSPVQIFPSRERHRPVTGTKLYYLEPKAQRCEQLAQGFYAAWPRWLSNPRPNDLMSNALPLRHCATE